MTRVVSVSSSASRSASRAVRSSGRPSVRDCAVGLGHVDGPGRMLRGPRPASHRSPARSAPTTAADRAAPTHRTPGTGRAARHELRDRCGGPPASPPTKGVLRGCCDPTARHTRFGSTAITVGASGPGERIAAAPGHKRIRELEDRSRQFVSLSAALRLWPRWGANPGKCPISSHQA